MGFMPARKAAFCSRLARKPVWMHPQRAVVQRLLLLLLLLLLLS